MCDCSSKSKCKTKNCNCVKLNEYCDSECACSIKLCENRSEDDESSDVLSSDNEFCDICSEINKQISIQVTHKRDNVFLYRDDVDIYTGSTKEQITTPHVDHIIETQMLAYATASVKRNTLKDEIIYPLRESINQNYNYNVTSAKINQSKGACIKSFLGDGMYKDEPLRAVVLDKYCEKYIEPISNAMLNSYNYVDESIRSLRVTNNYVTGNSDFEKIADELSSMVDKMNLDINNNNDHRILRSNKKNNNKTQMKLKSFHKAHNKLPKRFKNFME